MAGQKLLMAVLVAATAAVGEPAHGGSLSFPYLVMGRHVIIGRMDEGCVVCGADERVVIRTIALPASETFVVPSEIEGLPVKEIGMLAFRNCETVRRIVLPEGVDGVASCSFFSCSNLTEIVFPSSVKWVGTSFIGDCPALERIEVAPGNTNYVSQGGVLYERCPEGLTLFRCPPARSGCFDVPEGVTSIETAAFGDCTRLKRITLPKSLEETDGWAFDGCSALEELFIPDGVQKIGPGAFQGCHALSRFTVSPGNKSFIVRNGLLLTADGKQIVGCPATLTSVVVPEGVEKLEVGYFEACLGLERLVLPASLEEVWGAMGYLESLVSVEVAPGNTNFVVRGGLLLSHDGTSVRGCPGGLKEVTVPKTVNDLGKAFIGATNLRKIRFECPPPDDEFDQIYNILHNCPDIEISYPPEYAGEWKAVLGKIREGKDSL